MLWFLIGIGGALGALARHALNALASHHGLARSFPLAIFVINVFGSLLIGLLAGLLAGNRIDLSGHARAFLIVGVLGGFTTFSSFSLDTLTLAHSKHYGSAAWNVVGQVGLSLVAAWLSFRLGSWR